MRFLPYLFPAMWFAYIAYWWAMAGNVKSDERREFMERYTAFHDESVYETHVDYRRKRGLLEEINQSALRAEADAAALRAAERALRSPPTDGQLE